MKPDTTWAMAVGCNNKRCDGCKVARNRWSSIICRFVGVLKTHILGLQSRLESHKSFNNMFSLCSNFSNAVLPILDIILFIVIDSFINQEHPVVEMLVGWGIRVGSWLVLLNIMNHQCSDIIDTI